MSIFEDFWDDITGKTAAEEGAERAREENLSNQNKAAAARVFAETEGQGIGDVGSVALGVLDDDEELMKRRKATKQLSV